jgi:hypothetical protein
VFIERLWRRVKYEDVYLREYADGHVAQHSVFKYFAFYNGRRLRQHDQARGASLLSMSRLEERGHSCHPSDNKRTTSSFVLPSKLSSFSISFSRRKSRFRSDSKMSMHEW